jgi:hypothetical protein
MKELLNGCISSMTHFCPPGMIRFVCSVPELRMPVEI